MVVPLTRSPYQQNPIAELGAIGDWFVNAATGNDSYDGQSATNVGGTTHGPWASIEKANAVISPNGARLRLQQATTVHVATGAYGGLKLYPDQTSSGFPFLVDCATTSAGPWTLATVVNTNPAGPTRGRITAAGATFTNRRKLRCVTGSHPGAVTYINGVTSATDCFVQHWYDPSTDSTVDLAPGDTIVQDTIGVSFNAMFCQKLGPDPGAGSCYTLKNANVARGASLPGIFGGGLTNTITRGPLLQECEIGAAIWNGVFSFIGCRAPTGFSLCNGVIAMAGCAMQNGSVFVFEKSLLRPRLGCGVDAAQIHLTGDSSLWFSSAHDCEFENGGALLTAIEIDPMCRMLADVGQQLWGVTGTYGTGVNVHSGATICYDQTPTIPSTVNSLLAGVNTPFGSWPVADTAHAAFIAKTV